MELDEDEDEGDEEELEGEDFEDIDRSERSSTSKVHSIGKNMLYQNMDVQKKIDRKER